MKKLFALALAVSFLGTLTPGAARADDAAKGEKKKSKLTEEQRKLRKEIVDKYDADKNGKLSKEERSKISKEDKEKMEKAGVGQPKKAAGSKKKEPAK